MDKIIIKAKMSENLFDIFLSKISPPFLPSKIILGYSYIFKTKNDKYTYYQILLLRIIMRKRSEMISYKPLFETMKHKGVTSYGLEKAGFSRATYYSIKQGNSISTNTINQLCRILQCPVCDIIEYIDEENSSLN